MGAGASFLLMVCAVSAITITLTRSHLSTWFKEDLTKWQSEDGWLYKLFDCPWCMSHWVALPFAVWLRDGDIFKMKFLILWLGIVMLSGLIVQFYGTLVKESKG